MMRDLRLNATPKVTLEEMGSDPSAPRQWSHGHLSRCERGLLRPQVDLLRWYVERLKTPPNFLVAVLEEIVGSLNESATIPFGDQNWRAERIQAHVHLIGSDPYVSYCRDSYVVGDEPQSTYSLFVDTYDPSRELVAYEMTMVWGGKTMSEPVALSPTIRRYEIDLGMEVKPREWHRLIFRKRIPAEGIYPMWAGVSTHQRDLNHAQFTIAFTPAEAIDVWKIPGVRFEMLNGAFGLHSADNREDLIGVGNKMETGRNANAETRFTSMHPGLYYGIGWKKRR
jgi:hypothetical protein